MINNIKIHQIVIWLLAVLTEVLTYYLFFHGMSAGSATNESFIMSGTAFVVWSAMLGLCFVFLSWQAFSLSLFVGVLPSFLFFNFSYAFLGVMVVFSLLGTLPYMRAEREYKNRIIFYPTFIFKKGVPLTLTLFALLLSMLAYPLFGNVGPQDVIPKGVLELGMEYAGGLMSGYFLVPAPTDTVDEYLIKNLERQGVDMGALSSGQRSWALGEARDQFAKTFGVPLSGSYLMGDVVYDLFLGLINKYTEKNQFIFPWIFSLGFFLLLKTLFVPISWIGMVLFWAIISIGRMTGIIKIELDNVLKERLVI